MEVVKQKKGVKEFFRKFIVSLKKRTNRIPQFVMVLAFVFYSVCLSTISNTTYLVNKTPMGLCSFVTMLLSVLAFVSSLNAFVPRAKPKIFMVIVMYLMEVLVAGADILYLVKIQEGLSGATYSEKGTVMVHTCATIVTVHCNLIGVTILLFVLVPVLRKLLNKIDTSVDLGEGEDIKSIELEDEE